MLPLSCPLDTAAAERFLAPGAQAMLPAPPEARISSDRRVRFVLIGRTTCGKTTLANALTGQSMFTSAPGRTTKALTSLLGTWETLDGISIDFEVIDTPVCYPPAPAKRGGRQDIPRLTTLFFSSPFLPSSSFPGKGC